MGTIRVMVADPHPITCQGLAALLDTQRDMTPVGQAYQRDEAHKLYTLHKPDVVLTDWSLFIADDRLPLSELAPPFPGARILVFTNNSREESVYRAVQAGAHGYLLKSAACEEILQAVRAVYRGRKHFSPEALRQLTERLSQPELSERERDVLWALAQGKSNQEMARLLYISPGTVKYHLNHILIKLNVSDRTQALIVAHQRGLINLDAVCLPGGPPLPNSPMAFLK